MFFWDGLFGSSFSLPLICWPFVFFLYTSCILSLFWSIYYSLSNKKKKNSRMNRIGLVSFSNYVKMNFKGVGKATLGI